MANKSRKLVRRQPPQLLWFGAIAGVLFTFFGVLALVLEGDSFSNWRIAKEVLLTGLAFWWAVDSILKLRVQKAGNR
ncbi:MAG: hypothetical protein QFB86_04240 [Patescibacteria group bacterium]|nr:hypothetical protein [Patescibacteria group bacterium]